MRYTVRNLNGKGYIIEDKTLTCGLALVSFAPEINNALTEEQKVTLVNEFKDILIERLNLPRGPWGYLGDDKLDLLPDHNLEGVIIPKGDTTE